MPSYPVDNNTIVVDAVSVAVDGFFVGGGPPSAPATYYVAGAGNDAHDGLSPATAWATLAKVSAHSFVPGDTILFNGGDTFSGGITLATSGSAALPITFSSYGTGVPTISSPAGTHGFYAHNCGYITVQNLNFVGHAPLTTWDAHGIYFYVDQSVTYYSGITIRGVNVTGYTTGILISGSSAWDVVPPNANGFNNYSITNSTSHDNTGNGIIIGDTQTGAGRYNNGYIGYCKTYNNTGSALGVGSWSGAGIFMGGTATGLIEYCVGYANGTDPTAHGSLGIWIGICDHVTIQFCESYNNKSPAGTDGGGFDIDGGSTNCIIQYCYSHGNQGEGYLFAQWTGATAFSNNIIRYNISENDGFGIALYGETSAPADLITNSAVYNNVVYVSRGPAIFFEGGDDGSFHGSGLVIENNIFVTANQPVTLTAGGASGTTFSHNDYFAISGSLQFQWFGTTYTTLASWGQDPAGLTSNPLLTNPGHGGTIGDATKLSTLTAYQIQSTSPMIGAGTSISNPGTQDFYGNPLYYQGQIDIGAHEFTPAVVPKPQPPWETGPLLVPVYAGQNQSSDIPVPASIAYREPPYAQEEGPWAMLPYASLYPPASQTQGSDVVPPPVKLTDIFSAQQTWPL